MAEAVAERRNAMEMRGERIKIVANGQIKRRGRKDLVTVGRSNSLDVVGGEELVTIKGDLDETTVGHRNTTMESTAMTIHGILQMLGFGETVLLGGGMSDVHEGPEVVIAAMSDDLVGGAGCRVSPANVFATSLLALDEMLGVCLNDGVLVEKNSVGIDREMWAGLHKFGGVVWRGTMYATAANGLWKYFKLHSGFYNRLKIPPGVTTVPVEEAGSEGGGAAAAGAGGTLAGLLGGVGGGAVRGGASTAGASNDLGQAAVLMTAGDDAADVASIAGDISTTGPALSQTQVSNAGGLLSQSDELANGEDVRTVIGTVDNVATNTGGGTGGVGAFSNGGDGEEAVQAVNFVDEGRTGENVLNTPTEYDLIWEDPQEALARWRSSPAAQNELAAQQTAQQSVFGQQVDNFFDMMDELFPAEDATEATKLDDAAQTTALEEATKTTALEQLMEGTTLENSSEATTVEQTTDLTAVENFKQTDGAVSNPPGGVPSGTDVLEVTDGATDSTDQGLTMQKVGDSGISTEGEGGVSWSNPPENSGGYSETTSNYVEIETLAGPPARPPKGDDPIYAELDFARMQELADNSTHADEVLSNPTPPPVPERTYKPTPTFQATDEDGFKFHSLRDFLETEPDWYMLYHQGGPEVQTNIRQMFLDGAFEGETIPKATQYWWDTFGYAPPWQPAPPLPPKPAPPLPPKPDSMTALDDADDLEDVGEFLKVELNKPDPSDSDELEDVTPLLKRDDAGNVLSGPPEEGGATGSTGTVQEDWDTYTQYLLDNHENVDLDALGPHQGVGWDKSAMNYLYGESGTLDDMDDLSFSMELRATGDPDTGFFGPSAWGEEVSPVLPKGSEEAPLTIGDGLTASVVTNTPDAARQLEAQSTALMVKMQGSVGSGQDIGEAADIASEVDDALKGGTLSGGQGPVNSAGLIDPDAVDPKAYLQAQFELDQMYLEKMIESKALASGNEKAMQHAQYLSASLQAQNFAIEALDSGEDAVQALKDAMEARALNPADPAFAAFTDVIKLLEDPAQMTRMPPSPLEVQALLVDWMVYADDLASHSAEASQKGTLISVDGGLKYIDRTDTSGPYFAQEWEKAQAYNMTSSAINNGMAAVEEGSDPTTAMELILNKRLERLPHLDAETKLICTTTLEAMIAQWKDLFMYGLRAA